MMEIDILLKALGDFESEMRNFYEQTGGEYKSFSQPITVGVLRGILLKAKLIARKESSDDSR